MKVSWDDEIPNVWKKSSKPPTRYNYTIVDAKKNKHVPLDVCSALLDVRVAVRGHLEHSPAVSPVRLLCFRNTGDNHASIGGEHIENNHHHHHHHHQINK